MKKIILQSTIVLIVSIMLLMISSCERDLAGLEPATYPTDAGIYIDGFEPGVEYQAFGGSLLTSLGIDNNEGYESNSSLTFTVPDVGDPSGMFAGGVFISPGGRDLTGYDALTFYAKASINAEIGNIGFGNDNANDTRFVAERFNVPVSTVWKKYIIPIPDPAKLDIQRGLFHTAIGAKDGSGFMIWYDEVKFEKLGTIAHKKPMIFDGEDKIENAVNGSNIQIDGLSVSFNMPDGKDQIVSAAPGYFNFNSSNSNVATVDSLGKVTVLTAGTAVITADISGVDAEGSLTVESSGDFEHAPIPAVDSADVISIFSDAYTNVPVDFYNGYWEPYQTTLSADFEVDGDNVLSYTNFNFVGIEFSSPTIDATNMTHLHMDVYVPNAIGQDDKLLVKLVDMGADGISDEPNNEIAYTIESSTLESQKWVSVDIDIAGLATNSNFFRIILENAGTTSLSGFYLDNIYLYKGEGGGGGDATEPTTAAPAPTADEADVISIFSDAYTNLEGTDYPNWGQTTVLSNVPIDGNETIKLAGLNFQGIQLASSQDLATMTSLHIDVWTANSTLLDIYLISTGPVEAVYSITVPTNGWSSIDIPMSAFSGVDLTDIIQLKFDGNGDVWFDNLYFYKDGGGGGDATEPITAAPNPTVDEADVISIFSDAYTNLEGTDYPNWGQTTVLSNVPISGNETIKLAGLNFQGIQLASSQDFSAMTSLHIDVWTANSTLLDIYLISTGPVEVPYSISVPTNGWSSVDIPLTAFASVDLADVIQLKFDGNGDVWFDNLYLYKESGGGGGDATEPTTAAHEPTQNPADVYSLFSDAYTNTTPNNFTESWGDGSVEDFQIGGNNIKKYTDLNFQAIGLSETVDLSAYTHIHVDVWTPIENKFGIKFQDFGADNVDEYPNVDDSEMELESSTIQSAGTWIGHDFAIADFTGLSGTAHLGQIQVLLGSIEGGTTGTAFIDNLYLYGDGNGGGGGDDVTGPSTSAPTPPAKDAANVVSIYSDAYANITTDNFDAGWCGGAAATELTIVGNNTLKKNTGVDCHGIDFSTNRQDLSSFTHIHFDFYTNDTDLTGDVFNVKLVDFAGGNGEVSALEVNINTGTTPAIVAGSWVSVDLDITSLGGVVSNNITRSDVAQIGITTANLTNVWYDNIYLYK